MGEVAKLCATLHGVHRRHHVTTDLIAQGINEFVLRNHLHEDVQASRSLEALAEGPPPLDLYTEYQDFQAYLERVFTSRANVRFLIGHFVEAVRQILPEELATADGAMPSSREDSIDYEDRHAAPRFVGHDPADFVGSLCQNVNIAKVARIACDNGRNVMLGLAGDDTVPHVELTVVGDQDFTFCYSPKQAFNIITALVAHALKQEMRMGRERPRPIQVLVSQGPSNGDAIVRITDFGGGIALGDLETATTFLYSGRKTQALALSKQDEPMKGWMRSSLRLPVAAVLARCLGGDLTVASADGDHTSVSFYAPTSGTK